MANLKIEPDEVSQTFNFKKDFGVDLSGRPDLALRVGQAIIDKIVDRTENQNKSIKGNPLKGYSTAYKESDEFADFGKSPNDVNMTLTGRMMDDMDILNESNIISNNTNVLKVGFVDGTETLKAYAHNIGRENDPKVTVPKREFFGLNKKEINDVKKSFSSEFNEIRNENIERDVIASFLLGSSLRDDFDDLFGNIFNV